MSTASTSTSTPVLLSLAEVAVKLDHAVSVSTLWRACNRGEIPTVRLGRRILVPRRWIYQLTGDEQGKESL